MYKNIFKRYNTDELYVGLVTVYQTKTKRPDFVKVEVPEGQEKIQYITILKKEKYSDNVYTQIDNNQLCFESIENKKFSNFPITNNLIPLKKFYKNYFHKELKRKKYFLYKKRGLKIIEKAQKERTVIL